MKQFKEFDRKLSRHIGELALDALQAQMAEYIHRWQFPTGSWPQPQVQHAVYEAECAEAWQRFRVGLKGLSTQAKLYRLEELLVTSRNPLDKIRIDNYIGALIRGGQLNEAREVVR